MDEPRSGDDLVRNSGSAQSDSQDDERDLLTDEVLRRLRNIDQVPPPNPVFVRQVREELMYTTTISLPVTHTLTADGNRNGYGGPVALLSRPGPTRISRRRSWLTSLVTAALVLLTLIGSYFAFGRGLRPIPQEEAPVLIPAVVGTPEGTPATGITEDTILFQQRIDEIPTNASWAGVERITLDPGGTMTQGDIATAGVGPTLYRVEHGAVSMQADGPTTVTRAGSSEASTIPPGTTVDLTADDVVFTPNGAASHWRNGGTEAAVLLDAGIQIPGGEPPPDSGETYVQPINDWPVNPPPAPVNLTLRRVTLAPGGSVPNQPIAGLRLAGVDAGVVTIV